jgi:hypothetical protein
MDHLQASRIGPVAKEQWSPMSAAIDSLAWNQISASFLSMETVYFPSNGFSCIELSYYLDWPVALIGDSQMVRKKPAVVFSIASDLRQAVIGSQQFLTLE